MTNSLIEQDLKTILANADGSYVEQYEAIVKAEDSKAVAATRSSRESRTARWKAALAKMDRKDIAVVNKSFQTFIRKLKDASPILSVEEPTRIALAEANQLMGIWEEMVRIEDTAKATREQIKARVSGAMTAEFAEEGEEYPEQINASIDAPEYGKRFARQGCGRKDPELDEKKLAKLLGEKLWKQVSTEEVVVKRNVDIEALMAAAQKDPEILEKLRASLKVGEWKSPSFAVHNI
ncbi:hypothetical protein MYRNA_180 [Mycobacterium phage Myrna]|uniref:Uncharacterized protein n=1 Tax=Mycobacterium phage Myrna TaxID=546805 RepID=B5LJF2_9CAUD|nr:gp180 [Mycobacterium phage Myrna]ACH62149.1 hypothetical protein MYRNA_180 [Mycobacterium phage Myrna]